MPMVAINGSQTVIQPLMPRKLSTKPSRNGVMRFLPSRIETTHDNRQVPAGSSITFGHLPAKLRFPFHGSVEMDLTFRNLSRSHEQAHSHKPRKTQVTFTHIQWLHHYLNRNSREIWLPAGIKRISSGRRQTLPHNVQRCQAPSPQKEVYYLMRMRRRQFWHWCSWYWHMSLAIATLGPAL